VPAISIQLVLRKIESSFAFLAQPSQEWILEMEMFPGNEYTLVSEGFSSVSESHIAQHSAHEILVDYNIGRTQVVR
jgi:hypothetical protein